MEKKKDRGECRGTVGFWGVVVLAATLSADVLGIGFSCAVRGVRVSIWARLIIAVVSAVVTLCGVLGGTVVSQLMPQEVAVLSGGVMLCLLGGYIIISAFTKSEKKKKPPKAWDKIFALKPLGITIRIIRDPKQCDLDGSAMLDFREALYTGIAVSTDSFAAGISMGMNDWGSIAPLLCGMFQFLFLCVGLYIGKKIRKIMILNDKVITILSGGLLVLIGVVNICF